MGLQDDCRATSADTTCASTCKFSAREGLDHDRGRMLTRTARSCESSANARLDGACCASPAPLFLLPGSGHHAKHRHVRGGAEACVGKPQEIRRHANPTPRAKPRAPTEPEQYSVDIQRELESKMPVILYSTKTWGSGFTVRRALCSDSPPLPFEITCAPLPRRRPLDETLRPPCAPKTVTGDVRSSDRARSHFVR